jgi:DNA-binding CsgD family transcriptional regulator
MNTVAVSLIETGVSSISCREAEILFLMSEGKANKEIAACLSLSIHTVQAHLKNIYRKLDVHNKIEALNKTKWLLASRFGNRN